MISIVRYQLELLILILRFIFFVKFRGVGIIQMRLNKTNFIQTCWKRLAQLSRYQKTQDTPSCIDSVHVRAASERLCRRQIEKLSNYPEVESKKLMKYCELPWDKNCLEFYKRKDLISKTASNIQIRKGIFKHSLEKYLPYKNLLSKYGDKYSWFETT